LEIARDRKEPPDVWTERRRSQSGFTQAGSRFWGCSVEVALGSLGLSAILDEGGDGEEQNCLKGFIMASSL